MNIESNVTEPISSRVAKFAAMGDPVRLTIVDLLQNQDLSPDALASGLGISSNLIAHHLKILTEVGVITRSRSQADGRRTYLHLNLGAFADLLPVAARITTPRVVFVCTENSARSVMAEALWREHSDARVISAGTDPADRINPRTRTVVRRAGLTLEQREPRDLDDVLKPSDLIVSVCDTVNEKLRKRPNQRLHWSIPDPARIGTDAAFSEIFEEIRARVSALAPHVDCPPKRKRSSR